MTAPVSALGERIGHYRVGAPLGAGAMGTVWQARDERLDRDVALKVLVAAAGDEASSRRILREARAASALNHPNVCTVYEVVEEGGRAVLVMELVEGKTLDALLGGRALPIELVRRYGAQIADGLAHAHRRGVVHRDLKSGNVMITPDGRAKILDFGIAARQRDASSSTMHASVTRSDAESLSGTLPYMAPELLRGEPATPASDVWALGVLLHEMIAGTLPFAGRTPFEMSAAILSGARAAVPATADPTLRSAIERCLEARSTARVVDAATIADMLRGGGAAPTPSSREVDREAIRALAVLPLENLSGDPSQEFFADGMTDELIAGLTRLRPLRVISRTSVMSYKGQRKPLPEIAEELGVDAVLEGTVRRAGDHVRINVQLVHARSDTPLWTEQFDRDLRDVLELQSDVARAIAEQIRLQLPQSKSGEGAGPVNPEAFEACLRGRAEWQTRTVENLLRSIVHYRKAIDLDPKYALAFAGLADSYNVSNFHLVLPPRDSAAVARRFAERALELDPNLAEAYATLGYEQLYYRWDWAGSEASFRRALELNPNYAYGHLWIANLLTVLGRHEEALEACRRAAILDPLAPVVVYAPSWVYWYSGRFAEAVEHGRGFLEKLPEWHIAHLYIGSSLGQLGDSEAALRHLERGIELSGRGVLALGYLGYEAAKAGDQERGHGVLRELDAREATAYVPAMMRAFVHAGLGETDAALAQLERAVEERSHLCVFLDAEPRLASLRGDARFARLRERVGL